MRLRVILVTALLLVMTPAAATAKGKSKPLDVRHATEVGRAAKTNSLNGIYVSPVDGKVYVASVGGDEITVHSPRTGRLLDRIGPERGVGGPDDLFIADDGTIYWTEILTGRVGMQKPDGSKPKYQMVDRGVNPITMNDEGRLFVGRLFLGSGLYELDPELEDPPELLDANLNVNAFDFGRDGFLYAPSQFTGEILKIDVDAARPVGGEVVADGFRVPTAAKFNARGRLHVGDFAEGQVWRLNLARDTRTLVLDIEGTIDNIAFGGNRLFAAAGSDNQIIRRDHRRVKVLNKAGLGLPGGVAVSPDGDVWVGDFFVMRGFERGTRKWTTSFYERSDPPGQGFAGAGTVAADGDHLITTNGFTNSVQVLDPATGDILQDVRTLASPTNALRHGDTLVAAQLGMDPGSGQASVVNAEDPTEVLIDGLVIPLGLASDGDTLYVGDWATGNVFAVDDSGSRVLASGLMGLEGLAVHRNRLLAVETGRQQVTAIDLATGATSPAITGFDFSARTPAGFFPYGMMSGVAVGKHGKIYVSDDGVNKVYKFRTSRRHRH